MKLRQVTLGFLIRDNQLLLAMKKRGFGAGKWNGVGGKLDKDETIEETSKRETMEEIGVVIEEQEIVAKINFHFKNKPEWDQQVIVFKILKWQNEPQESEEMAPNWFNIDEIPYEKMWIDDIFWLPRVLKGEKILARFVFDDNENILEKEINNF